MDKDAAMRQLLKEAGAEQTAWCHTCEKVLPITALSGTQLARWRAAPGSRAVRAHFDCGHEQVIVMSQKNIDLVPRHYR